MRGGRAVGTWQRLAAGLVVAVGCGETTEPPPPGPATIAVASAIDSLLAVGRTAQLAATALDESGDPLTGVTFTWTTSNDAVISVSTAGLATANGPGAVTVTATADGDVTGTIRLRAVPADLAAVATLSGDPFGGAVVNALSTGARGAAQTAWGQCASGTAAGNVVDVVECLDDLGSQASAAADPVDKVLFAVLVLFADQIRQRLGL